jgi:putative sigma-54 modulation protein
LEFQIRGNGISISDELHDYADQRLAKLDRLVRRVTDAKLELRRRTNRSGPSMVTAQLTIQTSRNLLRAEEDAPDAKVAIDRVVDKLGIQLRRYHDRRTDHKASKADLSVDPTTDAVLAEIVAPVPDDDDENARVVRTKRFDMKPMDVDEAIDQMELLGHDFFVFDNIDDGTISVVYRRRFGDYGLIIPDRS